MSPLPPKSMGVLADQAFSKKDRRQGKPILSTSDHKVIQTYKKQVRFFSSQALPKVLQIIPSLANWEAILFLTCPSNWSSDAVLKMTRLFLHHVKANQTKQYFQYILVHAVQSNLRLHQSIYLDSALHQSLMLSITSHPGLFLKGYVFTQAEHLSLTEANLLCQIITPLPVLYTSMALLEWASYPLTLPICLLIDKLIDQQSPLPCRVIHSLVYGYFGHHLITSRPYVWYQSFLSFISTYQQDLIPDQIKELKHTIQSVAHHPDFSFPILSVLNS
ncbi:Bystin [Blakeslea trispora]|nr:Bystin [Blakeslea trispora]